MIYLYNNRYFKEELDGLYYLDTQVMQWKLVVSSGTGEWLMRLRELRTQAFKVTPAEI